MTETQQHHDDGDANDSALLRVHGLAVSFRRADGAENAAVTDVSFTLYARQMVAIVGESGSGKSVTALSVLRLLPPGAATRGGSMTLRDRNGRERDLLTVGGPDLRAIRGGEIAMIFQEPMTSLNPVFTVGEQIIEVVRRHRGLRGREARAAALDAMREARMPEVENRFRQYPHELSGGLRQRVMIAMALAGRPRVLLADEPTTALDVTVQAEILSLLRELRERRGLGLVFITHDLGLVSGWADVVCVMYAGRVLEYGPVQTVFGRPAHPYTRALLACAPRIDRRSERLATIGELMGGELRSETGGLLQGARAWWPDRTDVKPGRGRLMRIGPDHALRVADGEGGGAEDVRADSRYRRACVPASGL